MMRRTRYFAAALLLFLLLALALALGRQSRAAQAVTEPTVPTTVPVSLGDVQQTLIAPGQAVGTKEQLLSLDRAGQVAVLLAQPGKRVAAGDALLQLADATNLTAPFAGTILEVFVRVGEPVQAGQPLLLLADPTALEVRVTLIEEDLPLLTVGQSAELYFDALPDAAATGHVSRIVPQRIPGENRPLYPVYLTLDDPLPGMVAGMTTDAVIIVATQTEVLRLPRTLVQAGHGDTATVQVWDGNAAASRTIQLGLRGDVYVTILGGLDEGDEVIAP